MVAADETEQGERALLNLGHTFGHAFERLTGYDGARLVHGEAVAIGMACAFRFSRALGLCNGQDAMRVESHLRAVGLPTHIREIPGLEAAPEAILVGDAPGQKGRARPPDLHPRQRDRRELRRQGRRRSAGARLSRATNLRAHRLNCRVSGA